MSLRIEVLIDERLELGEGPLWDVEEQRLYFVDIFGRKIFRCDARGEEREQWSTHSEVGSMALRESGGAVLGMADGFHTFDFRSGESRQIANPDPRQPRLRLNDGKVDRQGRFLAGYIDNQEEEPLCSLYRLDTDFSLHELESGIICSNGPCWSRDGRTFYFSDSVRKTISAYDYDPASGAISNKRAFADLAALGRNGYPDGATVDEEDHVWCVEVFAGALLRFDPEGRLDRVVGLPVEGATSLSFGGADLDVAYVTSIGMPVRDVPPKEREAGALFAIHGLGVRGLPEPRFQG